MPEREGMPVAPDVTVATVPRGLSSSAASGSCFDTNDPMSIQTPVETRLALAMEVGGDDDFAGAALSEPNWPSAGQFARGDGRDDCGLPARAFTGQRPAAGSDRDTQRHQGARAIDRRHARHRIAPGQGARVEVWVSREAHR